MDSNPPGTELKECGGVCEQYWESTYTYHTHSFIATDRRIKTDGNKCMNEREYEYEYETRWFVVYKGEDEAGNCKALAVALLLCSAPMLVLVLAWMWMMHVKHGTSELLLYEEYGTLHLTTPWVG